MYDIRQFRPVLYSLLIFGMSGFALAAQSPGLWVISVGLVLLNGWLVKRGKFAPLPRFVANLVTVLALAYVVYEIRSSGAAPILVIGQFLVLLQLVKLYEQRANRDYAQLLVLSLLLIVAASINTASLLFGILLIIYLFLSLYCCLLFHLKVETDHAKAAIGIPGEKLNPLTLRQDQRFLSRSMRRLTAVVSITSVVAAVVVFLFFPRGAGSNFLGGMPFKPSQTLTGFNDQVNFQNVARITQNESVIAHVKLWRNGQLVRGTRPLLLRGTTLNEYSGDGGGGASAPWQWTRRADAIDDVPLETGPESMTPIPTIAKPAEELRQEIQLDPTGTRVLFALAGATAISTREPQRVMYNQQDGVLIASEDLRRPIIYSVISSGQLEVLPKYRQVAATPRRVDPKIEAFARRPEVSGSDAAGPLAVQRNPLDAPSDLDGRIAANIERYLRTNFTYTTDLTDARKLNSGEDPIVGFLYDFKKGHCEYFAGAMTLMCQSLGMDARMVVGFKCDEFNNFSDAYVVKQSHAHAWVEVRTPHGWLTFDPTSAREGAPNLQKSAWQQVKHLLDFLEYTWANSVIAYDRDRRDSLNRSLMSNLTNVGIQSSKSASDAKNWLASNWFTQQNFLIVSSKLLSALIWLMVFALVGAIAGFFWEKWRLRKRARRIGLDALPPGDQVRLARQLGFYDDLLQLLERHRITRPGHLTPQEFSRSLTFLPTEAYELIRGLTNIFYRIRYGRQEVTFAQRRRLTRVLERVAVSLESHHTGARRGVSSIATAAAAAAMRGTHSSMHSSTHPSHISQN